MTKICMVVQDKLVKGGIAAVVNGYRNYDFGDEVDIYYVESYKDGGKLTKAMKALKGCFDFIKTLLLNDIDIVHIHSSFGPSFYREIPFILLADMAKKPIINHIHGADFDVFYTNASLHKKQLIRNIYDRCTKIIALSDEWKTRLSKIVSEDKIVVIENYSTINKNAISERQNKAVSNTVLFLGELGKRKGCYDIPDVAANVVKRIPDIKFILAGAGTKIDECKIKEKIQIAGLTDNFCFPGWVRNQEKEKLLKEADVFFLPSYNEGMPMSILDAMGYALPIISTNVGGISRIVKNGENGYCIEAGNVEEMSRALIEIFTDCDKLKRFGNASYEIADKYYSLDAHIKLLKSVYDEVMRKNR